MNRAALAFAALLALVLAGGIGYTLASHQRPESTTDGGATSADRKVLYWYDPMAPQQHFGHPGVSPMGMEMVPKYADARDAAAADVVQVSPMATQNLGMRTAVVEVGRLADRIHVPGNIAWDLEQAVVVSARTNLTLARLHVRAPFTAVRAGQPLAEILAPEWSAAAAEYFALGNAQSEEGRALQAAARARLRALGMDDATLRGLRAGGGTITLRAPVAGVVAQLDAREGQQLGAGTPIMTINGLDQVWVEAAVPQAQASAIAPGTPITATVTALPGATFRGAVAQLLPEVDPTTRTQRARVVLDNPRHRMVPGMFADLRIEGVASAPHPLVPDTAIIADGAEARVLVALGEGRFQPVRVTTGRSADGMTAILSGLRGGERIVTSGQFLIDSEASLSGALERMGADHVDSHAHAAPAQPALEQGEPAPGAGIPAPASTAHAAHDSGTPTHGVRASGARP